MLPEFTCNFLATLAHPPWPAALRRNLYLTREGEERTPFHLYVRSRPILEGPCGQPVSFPCLTALPVELQLRILTFCSASTLFQLMRVSSSIRAEASKLFWAYSSAYFVVEAAWILDGGYPSYTCSNLAFLASVQNVQINLWEGTDDRICPLRNGTVEVRHDRIADFWKTFAQRCPRAKKVVVNQCWVSPPWREDSQCVPKALRFLVQSSPLGIATSAFIVEEVDEQWQRAMYQWRAEGLWRKVKLEQDWKAVLVPAKRFESLVERFQEISLRGSLLELEQDGLWPVLVESLDRYHFDSGRNRPFSCPSAGCDQQFQKAGEWTRHAAELHNQEWMGDNRFQMLPQAIRGDFEQQGAKLAEKKKSIWQDARAIRNEWKRGSKEQQRAIQRMWIDQVKRENASVTEEDICKSGGVWQEFWQEIEAECY